MDQIRQRHKPLDQIVIGRQVRVRPAAIKAKDRAEHHARIDRLKRLETQPQLPRRRIAHVVDHDVGARHQTLKNRPRLRLAQIKG